MSVAPVFNSTRSKRKHEECEEDYGQASPAVGDATESAQDQKQPDSKRRMQTHASAASARNGPATQRDINAVLAKFPEVVSQFIQHHQTKVLGVGSAAVVDADIELFTSDAVDGSKRAG